jgi:hypothetical protein
LDNAVVAAKVGDDRAVLTGDTDKASARPDVVRPNRPRPIAGSVNAITGTMKAVYKGIRTALALPTRKKNPDPATQKVNDAAPAAS